MLEVIRLGALGIWAGIISLLWPFVLFPVFRHTMPDYVWEGRNELQAVALTFDDGPDPVFTTQVLDILRANGIRATFFLVGERVRTYPEVAARIVADGHAVGNHSDSWKTTVWLGVKAFEEDLLRAERSLPTANAPKLFRPAGGAIRPSQARVLRKHGYRCVLASALPYDPYRPPASWIVTFTRAAMRPGGILVLHDSGGDRSNTLVALPRIVEECRRRGLRFLTVPESVSETRDPVCWASLAGCPAHLNLEGAWNALE